MSAVLTATRAERLYEDLRPLMTDKDRVYDQPLLLAGMELYGCITRREDITPERDAEIRAQFLPAPPADLAMNADHYLYGSPKNYCPACFASLSWCGGLGAHPLTCKTCQRETCSECIALWAPDGATDGGSQSEGVCRRCVQEEALPLLLEALGPDAAGRDFADLLEVAADVLRATGGGPAEDCLRLKAEQVRAALAAAEKRVR